MNLSFLRRGHANLLCIVPILVYVLPKRALSSVLYYFIYRPFVSLGRYIPKYFILFIAMVNAYPNFLKCKHITFSLNLANVGLQNFIKSILKFPWNTCVFIKSVVFLVASTTCHCIFCRLWGSPSIPACPGFALFPCLSHESPTVCWIPTHCLTPSAVNKHYGYL